MTAERTLSRKELTAALAARQLLLERATLAPAEAIRRLTPLQGQDSQAPYIALAARLDGLRIGDLQRAVEARDVVKTTIMRMTLHLVAAADYPAFAQLTRQVQMRRWRKTYAHLDEQQVTAELTAWFAAEPRSNDEIRERVRRYEGVDDTPWAAIIFARMLLPLIQLPRPATGATSAVRASPSIRARCPTRMTPRRSCSSATSPRSDPQAAATSRRGRASRSATSPPRWSACRRSPTATSTASSCSTSPARPLPPASTKPPPPLPRPLGPGAARLRRPRSHHPAGAAAAEAHAVAAIRRHGRRPRRRELAAEARREGRRGADRAAPRDPPLGARADPRGGQADRWLLRARRAHHPRQRAVSGRGRAGCWQGDLPSDPAGCGPRARVYAQTPCAERRGWHAFVPGRRRARRQMPI